MQINTFDIFQFVCSSNQNLLGYKSLQLSCTLMIRTERQIMQMLSSDCFVVNKAGEILLLVCVTWSLSVQPQHCWYARGINYKEGGAECL